MHMTKKRIKKIPKEPFAKKNMFGSMKKTDTFDLRDHNDHCP